MPHLTPLAQSGQIFLLDQPQVSHGRVSNVSFHKAIYAWCSNTETATAGASEKGPPTKEPLGFYTPTVQATCKSHSYSRVFAPVVSPSVHSAGTTKGLAVHGLSSQAPTKSSIYISIYSFQRELLPHMYSSTATSSLGTALHMLSLAACHPHGCY